MVGVTIAAGNTNLRASILLPNKYLELLDKDRVDVNGTLADGLKITKGTEYKLGPKNSKGRAFSIPHEFFGFIPSGPKHRVFVSSLISKGEISLDPINVDNLKDRVPRARQVHTPTATETNEHRNGLKSALREVNKAAKGANATLFVKDGKVRARVTTVQVI